MADREKPTPDAASARVVISPDCYAAWDPLLDTFDRLRADMPVAWIEDPHGRHPPFWLLTRYDDVMRVSKDNATFLNNPQTVVFSLTEGIEFARNLTGGSPHMVASLVTFDAPIHLKYRKLTQARWSTFRPHRSIMPPRWGGARPPTGWAGPLSSWRNSTRSMRSRRSNAIA